MSAWALINAIELSGAQSSITFENIPNTYTDLIMYLSVRSNHTPNPGDGVGIRFNDSISGYTSRRVIGTGQSSFSDSVSTNQAGTGFILIAVCPATIATANTFSNDFIYIPNYSGGSNKTALSHSASEDSTDTLTETGLLTGTWANTAAINKITLHPYYTNGNFVQYSFVSLYGVTKGSSGGVTVS